MSGDKLASTLCRTPAAAKPVVYSFLMKYDRRSEDLKSCSCSEWWTRVCVTMGNHGYKIIIHRERAQVIISLQHQECAILQHSVVTLTTLTLSTSLSLIPEETTCALCHCCYFSFAVFLFTFYLMCPKLFFLLKQTFPFPLSPSAFSVQHNSFKLNIIKQYVT